MPYALTMLDLPPAARPREKLLARGAVALADVELLALLLRTGRPGTPVLQYAQQVLERHGGLAGLLHTDPATLAAIDGMGPARGAAVAAVIELARRAVQHRLAEEPVFEAPVQVKEYARLQLAHLAHEVFAVMFLDGRHRLLRLEEMFRGTLTQTSVYPREVVKRALELRAAAVILLHNHPSGLAEPSRADEQLTCTLRSALALVDVRVLDHLVVGRGEIVSFAERALL